MITSLFYKFKFIKVIKLLFVILFLVACTTKQCYDCQFSNDKLYSNKMSLKKLIIPQDMSLPMQDNEYSILPVNPNGAVGKLLDIRPPIQNILLINNAHIESSLIASRLFINSVVDTNVLWFQINIFLKQKGIKIIKKDNLNHFLITDWVTWIQRDKNISLKTKQKIQLDQQNSHIIITVINNGMKNGEEIFFNIAKIQSYNILILNELISSVNELRNNITNFN